MDFDEHSNCLIGSAIEVHRRLGPGLIESSCEQCSAHELSHNGIAFQLQFQLALPAQYMDDRLNYGYRIDIFVENELVVELKSVDDIKGIHKAQRLTYMKMAGMKIDYY